MKKSVLAGLSALALFAPTVMADQGDLIVRGRVITVAPQDSTAGVLSTVNASVDTKVVPELDFTYMVTKNIGAELILGTSRHSLSSDLGGLGKVSVLPPTLTVQYHFSPDAKIRPYIGAGINYTHFYNNDLNVAGTPVSINNNSFGLAFQAGTDVMLNDKYFVNFDVKYLNIRTNANIGSTNLGSLKVNPLVFGVGIGRRFSF
ncbi:OmpW/AlkL family protein [Hydromonas duriensis]|uniref:Outer membrane protein n=1 Tax=Hydromonas duriensis TaxID=1527608 RepID=A0A4R6YAW8_9BURK|nr:OmpW family outer membrane protein [Hydromonas duriensis]TDR32719.1 outer membrane protein [Hydromonas duriensis]